jgi:hypothetical protein
MNVRPRFFARPAAFCRILAEFIVDETDIAAGEFMSFLKAE